MKNLIFKSTLFLFLLVGLFSCTTSDVPISYNIKLADSRLIGLWIGDAVGLEVKHAAGGTANFILYTYNSNTKVSQF